MEEQTGTALPWYDEVFRAGVEDASQATCLYQAVADFLVGVYLYRILVSLITERSGYMHYISIVAIIFCICIVRGILQTGYNSYYKPLLALRLDEGLSRVIHKKAE